MKFDANTLILHRPEQKLFDKHPTLNSTQRTNLFVVTKRLGNKAERLY